ncbi:MAG: PEGA domain-containing protein [bacterium]|nr:PEGA domain-containing protein [bacterium]
MFAKLRTLIVCLSLLLLPQLAGAADMAVLDFEDKSEVPSLTGQDAVNQLFTDLFPAAGITLIDRQVVQRVVTARTQEIMGELSPEIANILGKILEADILVKGDYEEIRGPGGSSSFLINASFIGTERTNLAGMDRRILDLFEDAYALSGSIERIVSGSEVIIDLGTYHGVKIGSQFTALRAGIEIAELQVSKTYRYRSEAIVVTRTADRLIQGDQVRKRLTTLGEPSTPPHSLIITSNPSSAQVKLDARLVGLSPLIIKNPEPKAYGLELIKEGYGGLAGKITLRALPAAFLTVSLLMARIEEGARPLIEPGSLLVTSVPTNAKIYLKGELKGTTPLLIPNLPPDLYELSLTRTGYETAERRIILKTGEKYELNIHLSPIQAIPTLPPVAKGGLPSPRLLSVNKPYVQEKSGLFTGLSYPSGVIVDVGVLDKLELRAEGFGIGARYRVGKDNRLALDLLYSLHNIYPDERVELLKVMALLNYELDTPVGLFDLSGGVGLLTLDRDEFVGFFGLETYITSKVKFLFEYDHPDGPGLGLRFPLRNNFWLDIGGADDEKEGWHPEGGVYYSSQ